MSVRSSYPPPGPTLRPKGRVRFVVLVGLVAVTLAGGTVLAAILASREDDDSAKVGSDDEIVDTGDGPYPFFDRWNHTMLQGVEVKHLCPAAGSERFDEEEVLAIVIEGQPRAYLRKALDRVDYHVVNDLVGDRPVTVTYCDVSDCARAFTDPSVTDQPLEVWTGGQDDNRLLLLIDDEYYYQDSEKVPLEKLELKRTTWAEWRALYPDSKIYTGVYCTCQDSSPTDDQPHSETAEP